MSDAKQNYYLKKQLKNHFRSWEYQYFSRFESFNITYIRLSLHCRGKYTGWLSAHLHLKSVGEPTWFYTIMHLCTLLLCWVVSGALVHIHYGSTGPPVTLITTAFNVHLSCLLGFSERCEFLCPFEHSLLCLGLLDNCINTHDMYLQSTL